MTQEQQKLLIIERVNLTRFYSPSSFDGIE